MDSKKHQLSEESSEDEIPSKIQKVDSPEVTFGKGSVAMNILKKLGFQPGKGLGKDLQGRKEPVQAEMKLSKQGLGYKIDFYPGATEITKAFAWSQKNDYSPEELEEGDLMSSFENDQNVNLDELLFDISATSDDYKEFLVKEKVQIGTKRPFCDLDLMLSVLYFKTQLDSIKTVKIARSRSNPYEKIGSCIFLNRAAMKMANIDYLTKGKISNIVDCSKMMFFGDVCAGPGGFSEYVLWRRCYKPFNEEMSPYSKRKSMPVRGFGLTLTPEENFKNKFTLNKFFAGPSEAFKDCSSFKQGDVTDCEVLLRYSSIISRATNRQGLHLLMADGGYDVSCDYNQQELLSHQLYLCQCLIGLMVLSPGGNFVTKLFDVFTEFSAHLIYLMSLCFERIYLIKPVTSRPANSERYLLCEGLLDTNIDKSKQEMAGCPGKILGDSKNNLKSEPKSTLSQNIDKNAPLYLIIHYLMNMNILMNNEKTNSVMPSTIEGINLPKVNNLKVDLLLKRKAFFAKKDFIDFVKTFNDKFAKRQCRELSRIPIFENDSGMKESRQSIYRTYLDKWAIPNCEELGEKKFRIDKHWPFYMNGKEKKINYFDEIIKEYSKEKTIDYLYMEDEHVDEDDGKIFCAIWLPWSKNPLKFTFLSRGHNNTDCNYDVHPKKCILPPQTIIYGCYTYEYNFKRNLRKEIFWIIDAAWINGEDVSKLFYFDRLAKAQEMIDAINMSSPIKLRTMIPFMLKDMRMSKENLKLEMCKDMGKKVEMFCYPDDGLYCEESAHDHGIPPDGILICRNVRDGWKYLGPGNFFNTKGCSDDPDSAFVGFESIKFHTVPFDNVSNISRKIFTFKDLVHSVKS